MITFKQATGQDLKSILSVYRSAFGGNDEASLVEDLLADPSAEPLMSLAAFKDDEIVGHVLFTKVSFDPPTRLNARILAPLAVLPMFQKKGVGRGLVDEGLRLLRSQQVELVFVLGDPAYYSRFGFSPAGERGLEAPYPIDPKIAGAWMVLELQSKDIGRYCARVLCARTLDKQKYWVE